MVKPDAVMCVNGEGMPNHKNPFISGELYIVFDVEFPQTVPESLRAKFREIHRLRTVSSSFSRVLLAAAISVEQKSATAHP